MVYGNVLVDYKPSLNVNYMVKPFQIIQLLPSLKDKIRNNFIFRLRNNMVYFNTPRYVFVNSKLMFALIYCNPKLRDLSFPILLDIYRLNDLN
jgi:hypothetical protein